LGSDLDYAMLIKIYGNDSEGEKRLQPGGMRWLQKRR
jgi:hypothetical protein